MRIAFVSLMEGYKWGGSEELWTLAAKEALAQGHEVFISVKKWETIHPTLLELKKNGAGIYERAPNMPITLTSRLFNFVKRKLSLGSKKSYWDHISSFKPDVICTNSGFIYDSLYNNDFSVWILNSKIPYSVIIQFNYESSPVPEYIREHAIVFFKNAAHLFFVSERNKKVAERNLTSELKNSYIVSNPCKFYCEKPLSYTGNPADLTMAYVARFDAAIKAQDILISILSSDNWKSRNWILNLYGSGPDLNYIRALINLYGLNERVFIHGQVDRIESIWASNQVMVFPSVAEGTPLSIVEAMHCGRACVANDAGGNSELIKDGYNGFISAGISEKAFSDTMERMWMNRSHLVQMGLNARESVSEVVAKESHKFILEKIVTGND